MIQCGRFCLRIAGTILEAGSQKDTLPQNLKFQCVYMFVSCHLLHIYHVKNYDRYYRWIVVSSLHKNTDKHNLTDKKTDAQRVQIIFSRWYIK